MVIFINTLIMNYIKIQIIQGLFFSSGLKFNKIDMQFDLSGEYSNCKLLHYFLQVMTTKN